MSDRQIKLKLHDPSRGMTDGWYESVWAEITDDGHARLLNKPVAFPKLEWGDIVEVKKFTEGVSEFLYTDAESDV